MAYYYSSVSVTRPANTSAYAPNDVIGAATDSSAALEFENIGRLGGSPILLTTVQLEVDIGSIPSGMTSFRLHLYSAMPPSALGDNAAFDIPSGDRASYLGYVDLGTPVDLGSTLFIETNQYNKQIVVPSGGSLFGYLVTAGGYTPSSANVFKITLHSVGL